MGTWLRCFLVSVGARVDVDVRDEHGCTALALAAKNGHAVAVAWLLARGANPNLVDLDQAMPLWYAARHGHTAVVRLLLASGRLSDLNPSVEGQTPLSIALKHGHRKTAKLLAHAGGIDPFVKLRERGGPSTAISVVGLAIRNGYEDVALALLNKCDPGRDSSHGSSDNNAAKDAVEPASKLLGFAASGGCCRIVRDLLAKHGADVNALYTYTEERDTSYNYDTFYQRSPLMEAARRGNANVVRLLLDTEGIQPDLKGDHRKLTALSLAAEEGFVEVVKMLVADVRVNPDQTDKNGRTALSYAAERAHETVVAELLVTGAVNPDSPDDSGRTPLMWAVDPEDGYRPKGWQPYEGVVRHLIASGRVNPNSRDSLGYTPLSLAARNGSLGLVEAILQHPEADPESGHQRTPLVQAAERGYAHVVRVLLDTGRVDVNAISVDYRHAEEGTALQCAARRGRQNVVQLSLSTPGIDLDGKDQRGNTLLMIAASAGKGEIVKQLSAVAGIDPNIQDSRGQTALCKASRLIHLSPRRGER